MLILINEYIIQCNIKKWFYRNILWYTVNIFLSYNHSFILVIKAPISSYKTLHPKEKKMIARRIKKKKNVEIKNKKNKNDTQIETIVDIQEEDRDRNIDSISQIICYWNDLRKNS